jgi:MoaA/NifB/PqqE/SkfB family radical SAM enzyme
MNLAQMARLARMSGRVLGANLGRLPYPLKINFALTYWCQYRCKTCNIWQRRPENELTTSEVLRFVRSNPRVSWLDVTGGEIFLRRDIEEILLAIVSTWKSLALLHFPTNGFLTDQIVKVSTVLARRGGPEVVVTVSVDGHQALNDEIRGIKGGFQRQVETFRALRRIRGIRPVFGMTLSRHNAGAFESTFEALSRVCPDLDVADFHLNIAQVSDHYYGNAGSNEIAPDRDVAVQELRLYRKRRGRTRSPQAWLENTYLKHLERYMASNEMPMTCHSLRSSCFIDPWGTVFPCITYSRPVGSLRDHDMNLGAIWHAPSTKALQSEIWAGDCPQCWTACEAYQSILGNLFRPSPARVGQLPKRLPVKAVTAQAPANAESSAIE